MYEPPLAARRSAAESSDRWRAVLSMIASGCWSSISDSSSSIMSPLTLIRSSPSREEIACVARRYCARLVVRWNQRQVDAAVSSRRECDLLGRQLRHREGDEVALGL